MLGNRQQRRTPAFGSEAASVGQWQADVFTHEDSAATERVLMRHAAPAAREIHLGGRRPRSGEHQQSDDKDGFLQGHTSYFGGGAIAQGVGRNFELSGSFLKLVVSTNGWKRYFGSSMIAMTVNH